jgi:serine/threonine protein kinase
VVERSSHCASPHPPGPPSSQLAKPHASPLPSFRLTSLSPLPKVESEIRILQQLSHDGLISYELIADEGSRISIVMAWAGAPLPQHRAEHAAAYSEDTARDMAHQLASALAFLHARGIVHRDIKPDNLGVQEDSRLQLFDWGEAITLAEAAAMGNRELSRRVGVAGTPLFMPPESLNHLTLRPSDDGSGREGGADGVPRLRATLSPALDVWGLGTVVFHLLAGRDIVPDSDWELEELADIVNGSDVTRLPEGVPASFAARDFLARCLERCPGRRASAAELLMHPWLRGAASRAEVEAARAADAAAARRALSGGASSGSLRRAGSGAGLAGMGMRRAGSGRLASAGSSGKLAAAVDGAPPPLVDGAAVCEVTVRMKPSGSCTSLTGQDRSR